MTQHEMENYLTCWLSEQMPEKDMYALMEENPDFKEYVKEEIGLLKG
jgi:hypothetical protein